MPFLGEKQVFCLLRKTKKGKQKKTEKKNKEGLGPSEVAHTKNNPTTKQKQNKQNRNKRNTKTKTNTRNTKTPKLSKPKINKNTPPHQKPKRLGKKQAFLTLLELCQTHQKQTTITLKPQKKQTPKTPFCHVQKQPTIFHKFSVFFNIPFLLLKSCVLLKTL